MSPTASASFNLVIPTPSTSILPSPSVSISSSSAPSSPPPEAVSDADTLIVPVAESSPENDDEVFQTGLPILPPQGASDNRPVAVPDTDDTDVVVDNSGTSNVTLADSDGQAPSIIADEKYRGWIGTGPAGGAFVPLMTIVGVLLVIALLVCLFLAISYGGPVKSYTYNSQTRPSDYGSAAPPGSGGAGSTTGLSPGGVGPAGTYMSGSGSSYRGGATGYEGGVGGPSGYVSGPSPVDDGEYPSGSQVNGASTHYDSANQQEYHMGDAVTLKNASVGTADYPAGSRTTLKNASVGTSDYPVQGLNEGVAVGGAAGAMTGYEENPETADGYPYAHPYGLPYEDGGAEARSSYRQSQENDTGNQFEEDEQVGQSYYQSGTETFNGDTQETYTGRPYSDENTRDTFDGVHNSDTNGDHVMQPHDEEYDGHISNNVNLNPVRKSVWVHNPQSEMDQHTPSSFDAAREEVEHQDHQGQYNYEAEETVRDQNMYGDYVEEGRNDRLDEAGILGRTSMSRASLDDEQGVMLGRGKSFSAGSSNPAPTTPYESGVPVEQAEDSSCGEEMYTDHMETLNRSEVRKNRVLTLSEIIRSSQRSQEPNSGPWPSWWNGDQAGHVINIHQDGPVSHVDLSDNPSSDPMVLKENNDHQNRMSPPVEDERRGVVEEEESANSVRKMVAMFGETNTMEGDANWQRHSHRFKHGKLEPNPEYDYLRKRREPYVKVVANRLSTRALSNSDSGAGVLQERSSNFVDGEAGYDLGAMNNHVEV